MVRSIAAMLVVAITCMPAAARTPQRTTAIAVESTIIVRDAALGAINGVKAPGSLADYEAAILFAVDATRQPCKVVQQGLELAYPIAAEGVQREAIRNVEQMCGRLTGTGAVGNSGTAILTLGPSLGGGGGGSGGTGNYSQ